MKDELVRFGIAMEPRLLAELDHLAAQRGSNRSELLRDLARAAVVKGMVQKRVPAVAAITLVYDHHVRALTERLTEIQHGLGESVRSAMHVHLDHDHCLEVIVMRGRSDALQAAADQLLGTRGVTHGGVEIISVSALTPAEQPEAHAHVAERHRVTKRSKPALPKSERAR